MPEIKENLIGIDPKYIFFQHLMNKIIPNIADKDDTFAPILCQNDEIGTTASEAIKSFFNFSRNFYIFQYRTLQTNRFKDYSAAWLPLVFLGEDWQSYLKKCTGFDFTSKFDYVERIKIVPVGKNEGYSFSVILKTKIESIDAKQYDEFEQKIKQKFNMMTTYYPEKKSLHIHSDSIKISGNKEDAFSLCTGLTPHWLDLLLEWGVIEKILFNYPYEISAQYPLKAACSTILVIPFLPPKWIGKEEFAITEISEELFLFINSPFYMALTSNSEEFLPLIENYLNNINSKFKEINNFINNDIKSQDSAGHLELAEFYRILYSKHIGFNENISVRESNLNDFPNINQLLCRSHNPDKGEKKNLNPVNLLKIKPDFFPLGFFSRVGSIHLLIMSLNIFIVILEKIIFEIKEKNEDSDNSEKKILSRYDTGVHEIIIRKAIINTQNLVVEILKIIKKNLETVKELISYSKYIEQATEREWHFLFSEEQRNDAFTTACKKLVKMAIDDERKQIRIKALASILYLLNPNDVISDYDPNGFIDDEFAVAASLRDIHEDVELDNTLTNFYKTYFYSVDEKINTNIRECILKQLDYFRSVLES